MDCILAFWLLSSEFFRVRCDYNLGQMKVGAREGGFIDKQQLQANNSNQASFTVDENLTNNLTLTRSFHFQPLKSIPWQHQMFS